MIRLLMAMALWFPMAFASANLGPADPAGARDYEVLKDALPDHIPAEELEVVLLNRKATCVREVKRLWGMPMSASNSDFDNTVCTQLIPLVLAASPEPVLTRQETWADIPASVNAALQRLEQAPQRRYVALVVWNMHPTRHYNGIEFEEVVIDRETGAWVWHAFRREQSWAFDTKRSFIEAAKVWSDMLHHDLVQAITQRGASRNLPDLPGARWIPPQELPTWHPGANAGLILVNRQQKMSSSLTGPMAAAEIRRADQTAVPPQPRAGGSKHHQSHPQRTPAIAHSTYAALELPPGDYVIQYGGELRTTLQAGEMRVLSVEFPFMGLGDALTIRDLDWFKAYRINWPRHAFLAEPRTRRASHFTAP